MNACTIFSNTQCSFIYFFLKILLLFPVLQFTTIYLKVCGLLTAFCHITSRWRIKVFSGTHCTSIQPLKCLYYPNIYLCYYLMLISLINLTLLINSIIKCHAIIKRHSLREIWGQFWFIDPKWSTCHNTNFDSSSSTLVLMM